MMHWMALGFAALQGVSARWGELALGAVVVALPVASIAVHGALAQGTEARVHELAHRLGRNMLVVPADTDLTQFFTGRYQRSVMPESYVEKLRSSSVASHLGSIQARLYGVARAGDAPVLVVGETAWRGDEVSAPAQIGEAMVGVEVASQLGVAAGATLHFASRTLRVSGVSSSAPDGLSDAVFASAGDARQVLQAKGWSALRLAGCWCRLDPATLARQVEQVLPGTRALTVAGMLKAQTGVVETVREYTRILHFGGIVLAAGIGWTLSISYVRRHRREIGLLLAIGGRPWMVALLLVVRAALMGLLGGGAGWVLAALAGPRVMIALTGVSAPIATTDTLQLIVAAALVCAVGALLPALEAASQDPVKALREA